MLYHFVSLSDMFYTIFFYFLFLKALSSVSNLSYSVQFKGRWIHMAKAFWIFLGREIRDIDLNAIVWYLITI